MADPSTAPTPNRSRNRSIQLSGEVRGVFAYGLAPALGILTGPVLARALGPSGRGQFASITEPITVAGAVAALGVPAAVTHFIARNPAAATQFRKRALQISAISAVATLAGLLFYAPLVSRRQHLPLAFVLGAWLFLVPSVFIQVQRGYLQGFKLWPRLDRERWLYAASRAMIVLTVAILGFRRPEWYVVVGFTAILIGATALRVPDGLTQRQVSDLPPRAASALLLFSITAAFGTISVAANNRMDQVLLPAETSQTQVGLYAVAVTVAEIPIVLAVLCSRNVLQLSSAGQSLRAIARDIRVYLGLAVLASILIPLNSGWAIPTVYGAAFSGDCVNSIRILSIGTLMSCLTFTAIAMITGRGFPLIASLVSLSGFIVTCAAFAMFWGSIGAVGAAWISTLSQSVSLVFAYIGIRLVERRTRVKVHD